MQLTRAPEFAKLIVATLPNGKRRAPRGRGDVEDSVENQDGELGERRARHNALDKAQPAPTPSHGGRDQGRDPRACAQMRRR